MSPIAYDQRLGRQGHTQKPCAENRFASPYLSSQFLRAILIKNIVWEKSASVSVAADITSKVCRLAVKVQRRRQTFLRHLVINLEF
jgi:hypothetical protein